MFTPSQVELVKHSPAAGSETRQENGICAQHGPETGTCLTAMAVAAPFHNFWQITTRLAIGAVGPFSDEGLQKIQQKPRCC